MAFLQGEELGQSPREAVTLTLEALKCGKRFHATVSLDTDTGLKQTLALVSDYNSLMKDFPLNELVSATDLDSIKVALGNVTLTLEALKCGKRFHATVSLDTDTEHVLS
ncbi:hypothetical protein DICVIV_07559 [Dictyocaulus viviparus]|uniref:Uncharacterized protein n=1 Tax=Dictyocaulus viviparus TaxID=29172 RepID=A0A0D8XVL1_DICVI|nr:hypothetical protein DICVIV_07559 [Dictyocaulus viviparus]